MNISKKITSLLAMALFATAFTSQPIKAHDPREIGVITVGVLAAFYGIHMLDRYKYDTKDRVITNIEGLALLTGGLATIFMSKQIVSDPQAVARQFANNTQQALKDLKKSIFG